MLTFSSLLSVLFIINSGQRSITFSLHLVGHMKKLFSQAFTRILHKLELAQSGTSEITSQQLSQQIRKTFEHDITYSKLSRLPLSEVKNMLKIPCPIEEDDGINERIQEIVVFKRLRASFNIDQESVCFKCKKQCPVRGLLIKNIDYKPRTTNKEALHDILLYLTFLSRLEESSISQLRWSAAYKVSSSLEVLLKDYKVLSRESLIFRDTFRQLEQMEQIKLNKTKKRIQEQEKKAKDPLRNRKIHLNKSPYK